MDLGFVWEWTVVMAWCESMYILRDECYKDKRENDGELIEVYS